MNQKAIQNAMRVAKQAGIVIGASALESLQVIATQAIQEKGWDYWANYPHVPECDFWNVEQINGVNLPTLTSEYAGTIAYGFALLIGNPNAFSDYVNNLRLGNWELALQALAGSPWASPPYGEELVTLYHDIFTVSAVTTTTNDIARQTYTVQKGQDLWMIASQHGIPFQTLKALNPQIKNDNLIYPDEKIYLN